MARLNDRCKTELSREDFDRFPVWVWDDEERQRCPVDDDVPNLSSYGGRAFVKAKFSTGRYELDGYLVGGLSFFAFALFVEDQRFLFNLNLPDMIEEDLPRFYAALGEKPFPLFPLRYESDVRFNEAPRIAGEFTLELGTR